MRGWALILFVVGSAADVVSSVGQPELNPLFRRADGRFNWPLNLLATLGLLIAGWFAHWVLWLIIGLARLGVAAHNVIWRLRNR